MFAVLDSSPPLMFVKKQSASSHNDAFAVSRKYVAVLVFSSRTGNVSQAFVGGSSLEESVSVSLQKEPSEGARSQVVVTSEQSSEPPTSLLPRQPSEEQKLYQDLLVTHTHFIFCTEHNSRDSTLLKLWCGIGMSESCMWFSNSHCALQKAPSLWFFIFFKCLSGYFVLLSSIHGVLSII